MSHYSVAVITKPYKETVEELLEPYDESISYPPYIEYTKEEAIEKVRKELEEYKNSVYAEYLNDPIKYKQNHNHKEHIAYLEKEFPKRLLWTDEECYQYIRKHYDDDKIDQNGNLMSTYNPNSKWDWYEEGGRWNNFIKLKSGGYANTAKIGDIDFSLDTKVYDEALRFWEVIIDEEPLKAGEKKPFCLYKKEYYTERYSDKYDYARSCAEWRTYAVLTPDGIWHEPGAMGWFGCSSASAEDDTKWEREFKETFIDTADPEWSITIIDCHI